MFENRALSPAQVAWRLQVSEDRVVRWLSAGQMRGLKIGDQWRTSTLFLATFLEARANRPAPKPAGTGAHGQLYAFNRRGRA
jgi:excisionase family DNA binding protein